MGKKNKDPLAKWTGPQIDKDGIDSVLDRYFEGRQAAPTHGAESGHPPSQEQTRHTDPADNHQVSENLNQSNTSINNEIDGLTGSMTRSMTRSGQQILNARSEQESAPEKSVTFTRLDATHTISEALLYSVMYRETHAKGIRARRFSIPELMKLSGIRSKNTIRRALAGLKEKLSIQELSPAQATIPPLYEIRKIREILTARSASGIEIDDRKVIIRHQPASQKEVSHSHEPLEPLTGSKFDPLTGSNFDPLLKGDLLKKEEKPATRVVEKSGSPTFPQHATPVLQIFEQVLNRGLTEEESSRVIAETTEILREWAINKSINATAAIREVTYLLNGLRQALLPKQAAKEIDPAKLRRWIMKLLKEQWPTSKERAGVEIGEAAEYIKQHFANHRINYSPHVSLISETITNWYQSDREQEEKKAKR